MVRPDLPPPAGEGKGPPMSNTHQFAHSQKQKAKSVGGPPHSEQSHPPLCDHSSGNGGVPVHPSVCALCMREEPLPTAGHIFTKLVLPARSCNEPAPHPPLPQSDRHVDVDLRQKCLWWLWRLSRLRLLKGASHTTREHTLSRRLTESERPWHRPPSRATPCRPGHPNTAALHAPTAQ